MPMPWPLSRLFAGKSRTFIYIYKGVTVKTRLYDNEAPIDKLASVEPWIAKIEHIQGDGTNDNPFVCELTLTGFHKEKIIGWFME